MRPQFNSHITSERLREGLNLQPLVSKMGGKIPRGRRPVFTEIGLDNGAASTAQVLASSHDSEKRPPSLSYERNFVPVTELRTRPTPAGPSSNSKAQGADSSRVASLCKRRGSAPGEPWYTKLTSPKDRPRVTSASGAPPQSVAGLHRLATIAMVIAVVIPAFNYYSRYSGTEMGLTEAGLV